MAKKIFDIGSSNHFNQMGDYFRWDEPKEKQFPPWLKLPTFYTVGLWRRIIEFEDGMFYLRLVDNNKVLVKLECKHTYEISEITLRLIRNDVRRIIVNCAACGGIGEVKTQ